MTEHRVFVVTLLLCIVHTVLGVGAAHRVAFGSCANPATGGKIWRLIDSFQPDHFVSLGDIMYTDRKAMGRVNAQTPRRVTKEYASLAEDKHWNHLIQGVKHWSAVYDDHDYGANNADKTFTYRSFSQDAFRTFAHDAFAGFDTASTDGVHSSKTVHTQLGPNQDVDFTCKLVLMDIRSNKDPRGTKNGHMLDEAQWQWLTHELSDTTVDLILLGSPIQILPDDTLIEEKWGDFPEERSRLLALITAATQHVNVVLLSGDVHRAEVSRATCTLAPTPETAGRSVEARLWELTSSGFSHTISQTTDDTPATSREDFVEPENASMEIPVSSKLWIVRFANAIYQFAYPAHYREDKLQDVYYDIHFGLLDLQLTEAQEAQEAHVEVAFSLVSYKGEVVMRKVLPLVPRSELQKRRRPLELDRRQQQEGQEEAASALAPPSTAAPSGVHCVPYQGEVPLLKVIWYRAVIAAALLVFVVAPVVAFLWYMGASLYYVLWGRELARREKLERLYQMLKKRE